MLKKYLTLFADGAFWFVFGFMVMAVPLIVICAFGALSGRYLESATVWHSRPTSRWFYENLVANGHYKTLAVYIGSISLAGGLVFVILLHSAKERSQARMTTPAPVLKPTKRIQKELTNNKANNRRPLVASDLRAQKNVPSPRNFDC
jgi:hypothetical protein